jgi:hypothetical protein
MVADVIISHPETPSCSDGGNVTRSLLGYLAIAGPFYVVTSLALALTRPGFNVSHNEWSLLALGNWGWIQTTNFIVTGGMIVAGAIGLRLALGRSVDAGTWAPRLIGAYGFALIGAGIFHADPAGGFPPGTPQGHALQVSWHGALHIMAGSIGFACLIAACFVVARSYARRQHHRAAVASRLVGLVFAFAFIGIASGTDSSVVNLGFTAAVVVSSGWLTAIAVDLYRRTRTDSSLKMPAR